MGNGAPSESDDSVKNSINNPIRLVGTEVNVSINGARVSGTLCSSGNHGVVLDVNGTRRTFSGFVSVRAADGALV